MKRLTITATPSSHIAIGGGLATLDALLASQVFDRTGSITAAHNDLPLKRTDGLWHASAALVTMNSEAKHVQTAALRPEAMFWNADLIKKNKHGKPHSRFTAYNIMNEWRVVDAESITWTCEGNAEEIERLLPPMIGKKRSCPVTWNITAGDLDGIIGYADEPLRPVPVSMWRGAQDFIRAEVGWRPAYWDIENRAICFIGGN